MLDFFEYSPSDIAVLVRKCHYDEPLPQHAYHIFSESRANLSRWQRLAFDKPRNQIQIAVANIIEAGALLGRIT